MYYLIMCPENVHIFGGFLMFMLICTILEKKKKKTFNNALPVLQAHFRHLGSHLCRGQEEMNKK